MVDEEVVEVGVMGSSTLKALNIKAQGRGAHPGEARKKPARTL
jgi:hypothetical protein